MSYLGKNPKVTSVVFEGYTDFATADLTPKKDGRLVWTQATDKFYHDNGTVLTEMLSGSSHSGLTLTNASIETPVRLDMKQDTEANLITYASAGGGNASDGQLCFAIDTLKTYVVVGNLLEGVGGGSLSYWQKELLADLSSDGVIGDLAVTGLTIGQKYEVTLNVKAIRTATAVNETQVLTFDLVPNYGKWQIEFAGQTTLEMGWDYSAAEVQTEMEALSNIVAGDVVVTGAFPEFTFTFGNTYAATDVAEITIPFTSLVSAAGGGTDEVQDITFSAVPTAGSFTLTLLGQTTSPMAYNIGAVTIKAQLESFDGVNNVTVVAI